MRIVITETAIKAKYIHLRNGLLSITTALILDIVASFMSNLTGVALLGLEPDLTRLVSVDMGIDDIEIAHGTLLSLSSASDRSPIIVPLSK